LNHSSHTEREQRFEQHKLEKKKNNQKIIGVCVGIFLLILSGFAYANLSPGKYDGFAKCLTEKGVIMYGEDWCPYTNAQKGMFGKSFKHITYVVKTDLKLRPTWEINGENYETVQSFQRLSALTGCKY